MIQRRLVFEAWSSLRQEAPFVPHTVFGLLEQRIAANPALGLLDDGDVATGLEILEAGTATRPSLIRLMALRPPDKRPLQWEPGTPLTPLQLTANQYPADVSYMMLWPDGYAAQDFHGHAPRFGRLAHFLRKTMDARVVFEPLFQPDTLQRLTALRGRFRRVEIALQSHAGPDARNGPLGTLIPAVFGERAPSVRVELGMGRYGPRDRYLDSAVEDAVIDVAQTQLDDVTTMVIHGRDPATGAMTKINLLHERLGEDVELATDDQVTGMPREDAMARTFTTARRRLEATDQLARANAGRAVRGNGS